MVTTKLFFIIVKVVADGGWGFLSAGKVKNNFKTTL